MPLEINKLLTINQKAEDQFNTWKEYKHQLKVILKANEVPDKAQHAHIISNAGDEGWDCWAVKEGTIDASDP